MNQGSKALGRRSETTFLRLADVVRPCAVSAVCQVIAKEDIPPSSQVIYYAGARRRWRLWQYREGLLT